MQNLYKGALDRDPDSQGFNDWVRCIQNGETGTHVARCFYNSVEFDNKHLSNEEYVRHLYKGLLGRDCDADGLKHYKNLLRKGSSREYVLEVILGSPEFRGRCYYTYRVMP